MKKYYLLIIYITAFALAIADEGTIYTFVQPPTGGVPQVITIPADSIFQVVTFSHENDANAAGKLTLNKDGKTVVLGLSGLYGNGGSNILNVRIAGPATITYTPTGSLVSAASVLSYKLLSNSYLSTIQTPSNAVVIPSDASGSVNIILESSIDLITWTAAMPGQYGSSTQKRFFRVRAVAN
jgi:hypothetical protein